MVGEVAGAILAVGDASPNKQGRCMPGSRVPVVSPEELIEAGPEEVLLLLADLQDEVLAAYPQLRGRLVAAGPGGIARPSRRIDAWPGSVRRPRRGSTRSSPAGPTPTRAARTSTRSPRRW